jgi:hypothetical protein
MRSDVWALEERIRRLEETTAAEFVEVKSALQTLLERFEALSSELRRTRTAIVQEHRSDRRLIQSIRR